MKSFIRANPYLTTNAKIVFNGSDIWLSSFSTNNLSNDKLKRYKVFAKGSYEYDLSSFWNQTAVGSEYIFEVFNNSSSIDIQSTYALMYEDLYLNKIDYLDSLLYDEKNYAQTTLDVSKDIPDAFIVFALPFNISYGDYSEFVLNLSSSRIVRVFDLKNSNLGTYLRKFSTNRNVGSDYLHINYSSKKAKIKGINLKRGGFDERNIDISTLIDGEFTQFEFDKKISSLWKDNGIVFPSLLNIDFVFDDDDKGVNYYYGFYVNFYDEKDVFFSKFNQSELYTEVNNLFDLKYSNSFQYIKNGNIYSLMKNDRIFSSLDSQYVYKEVETLKLVENKDVIPNYYEIFIKHTIRFREGLKIIFLGIEYNFYFTTSVDDLCEDIKNKIDGIFVVFDGVKIVIGSFVTNNFSVENVIGFYNSAFDIKPKNETLNKSYYLIDKDISNFEIFKPFKIFKDYRFPLEKTFKTNGYIIELDESGLTSITCYTKQNSKIGLLQFVDILDFDSDLHSSLYNQIENKEKILEDYNTLSKPYYNNILNDYQNNQNNTLISLNNNQIVSSNNEYEYLSELILKDSFIDSKVVPYVLKFGYGLDVNSNPYRLNVHLPFNKYNFSPSIESNIRDLKNYSHHWFYLSKIPDFYSYDRNNIKRFFNDKFDLNEYITSKDYFHNYFTLEYIMNTNISTQKKYVDIEKDEMFFLGVKYNIKKYINNILVNNFSSVDFTNWSFSVILDYNKSSYDVIDNELDINYGRVDTTKILISYQGEKNKPVEFKVFFNYDNNTILFYMNIKILETNLTTYDLDNLFLYSLKHIENNNTYLDIPLSGSLNLSSIFNLSFNGRKIRGIKNFFNTETDFKNEISSNNNGVISDIFNYLPNNNSLYYRCYNIKNIKNDTFECEIGINDLLDNRNSIIGGDVFWKNFKSFLTQGGYKYYEKVLNSLSFNNVKNLINLNDKSIEYYDIKNKKVSLSNHKFELETPIAIEKKYTFNSINDLDLPFNFNNNDIISKVLVKSNNLALKIYRHNGYYTFLTRKIFEFQNKNLIFDLTYFPMIENMYYHKVSKTNGILTILNNKGLYPLVKETAIDKTNHSFLKRFNDKNFYFEYIDRSTYNIKNGFWNIKIQNFFVSNLIPQISNEIKIIDVDFNLVNDNVVISLEKTLIKTFKKIFSSFLNSIIIPDIYDVDEYINLFVIQNFNKRVKLKELQVFNLSSSGKAFVNNNNNVMKINTNNQTSINGDIITNVNYDTSNLNYTIHLIVEHL